MHLYVRLGSNTDHISSPSKSSDSLLRDTSVTSLDLSGASSHVTSPLTSPLTSAAAALQTANQLHVSHQHYMTSPMSACLSAAGSLLRDSPYSLPQHPHLSPKQTTPDGTANKGDSSQTNKPRIWSMADMATASQTNNVTPPSSALDRRSPNAIAQSLINKSGYTSFSSPPAAGVQPSVATHPVFNGSYAAGLSTQVGTTLPAYRLGGYFSGAAGVGGVFPPPPPPPPPSSFHRPPSNMNVLTATPPAASLPRLNSNSLLGRYTATSHDGF